MGNREERNHSFKGCLTKTYQLLIFHEVFIERIRCGTQRESVLTQELITEAFGVYIA